MIGFFISQVSAYAHVPHDNVFALAAPDALDDSAPWVTVAWQSIAASHDGGTTWSNIGGYPMLDPITSGTMLDGGTAVFMGDQRLWSTTDGGASWTEHPLESRARVVASEGSEVLVATSTETLIGPLGGPYSLSVDRVFVEFAEGEAGVTGRTADGSISFKPTGGAWALMGRPPSEATVTAALVVGTAEAPVAYSGTADGEVWRLDAMTSTWTRCGALPAMAHPAVVAMGASGDRLLVAGASYAPYVSDDRCATFTSAVTGSETEFDLSGGASSDDEAFTVVRVVGDRFVVGGWDGLWISDNEGVTWTEHLLIPPDYTRGIAYNPEWPEDDTVFVGAYAAGVQRAFDGGTRWDAPGVGMSAANVQKVLWVPGTSSELLAISGHHGWRSVDGGERWAPLNGPFPEDTTISGFSEPDEIWLFSTLAGPKFSGLVAVSEDGGATWQETPELNAADPGVRSMLRFADDSGATRYLASSSSGISVAPDWRGPWTRALTTDHTFAAMATAWPAGDPERVVYATGSTIWLSEDDGDTFVEAAAFSELDQVAELAIAADGTCFALGSIGRVFRSDDCKAWEDTGLVMPALVHAIAPRPDFGVAREVLVGTHDGVYAYVDVDPPFITKWSGYQRIDDYSDYAHCEAGCVATNPAAYAEARSDASMGFVTRMVSERALHMKLRGHTLRLYGWSGGKSSVEVIVDGVWRADVPGVDGGPALLVEVTGLADQMHDVELHSHAGDDVLFDFVESWSDAYVFDDLVPEPDADTDTDTVVADTGGDAKQCGCVSGGRGAGWSGVFVVASWWRRRRALP